MGDVSMLEPPSPRRTARFADRFGQRSLLTVDTEEEFDWGGAFTRTEHGLAHVGRLGGFQQFCEGLGVSPVYLIDWPIVANDRAVEFLRDALARGTAEIGVQLHPWVNPPHDEAIDGYNSYAGNLPPALERAKLLRLRDRIEQRLEVSPLIYRAGRYGVGPHTAAVLKEAGIAIDSSIRSNFDYRAGSGPDYRRHPLAPYWIDAEHSLLELPLTTCWFGMLRRQGRLVHPLIERLPLARAVASRTGLLERIPLTPEGTSAEEALRGIDMALDDRLPLLLLSFHSPSLAPGHTPYVRNEDDLDALYDWFRRVYAYLEMRGVAPATIGQVMDAVER